MRMNGQMDSADGTQARFPTQTYWTTLIQPVGDPSAPKAREALNQLCQTYWFPIYAFIRRKGYDSRTAKDLTQSFFIRLLEKDLVRKADRQKGRFRSFLCAVVKNFLIDAARAGKHERAWISIDESEAESRYDLLPPQEPDSPKLFDRSWAATAMAEGNPEAPERLRQPEAARSF